ncbi:hypothetical protein [Flavobacterium ginsenosidimutans]|uniref:Hydrogenase nickel incorporation protein HypA n=1 Tax=Flavobacterium ginsenosidimutans TaxID=687844 RepID=A0ABZ2Q709_9FLAO
MTANDYKVGIFGGVIAVISSGVYDYIKEKPLLSSIKSLLIWIWEQIFQFEIKIWQILIIAIILIIIYSFSKTKKKEEATTISFRDYIRDTIHGTTWIWSWEYDMFENKWQVRNITPICDNCGTMMKYEFSYGVESTAKCPRCDNRQTKLKDNEIIEALIIDNIHQNLHLDKIKNK